MNNVSDLRLYLQLFRGREDCFAQQGEDFYFPVRQTLDVFYILRHLAGDLTFGLYVLNSASCCHLFCIDIDIPKSELSQVDFTNPDQKYAYLKDKLSAVLEVLRTRLDVPSDSILVEETGGRGYHIWVFFGRPVNGQTAVKFGRAMRTHLDFEIEFFPKQGRLTANRKYGNLIKLPLGIHQKYGSRSSFIALSRDGLRTIAGTAENLAHLRSVVPMSAEAFEASVTAIAEELPLREEAGAQVLRFDQQRPQFEGAPSMLIGQCTAMRNLRAKAVSGTRFSHSEAFHFADVMLSVADGVDIVHETMRFSLAGDYDRSRTQDEIERITPLHPPSCLTLVRKGVCPGYCKESVRKRNEDLLVPGTTPCSVWLRRKPAKPIAAADNLVERIGTAENIRRSFFQLRQYHEHEDALFFDPFDYEQFECHLDANCAVFAKTLFERIETPFLGYMPVALPKKINEAQELEYRGMSYSTLYDQAPIQAIFNVVAPVVESEFQHTSYGYRWNVDPSSPYRIFEDWREAYPRFRNDIMAALEQYPSGFHVCCDIKGYYDHVDHGILLEQLRKFVPDAYVYQMIERTVRAYTFADGGARGLPQGPAYARLLANLYLNEFDVFVGQMAVAYFRYVDDFVLLFETEKDAQEGLERVVRYLADLGLELSQDEVKRPVIAPDTDISRVRKTLDKIHYGILEGTRHLQHLAPQAVADFMEAVQKHSVSPVNLEELIKINDALPSLFYVVAQETLFAHQLQSTIVNIVEFLIQHQWFCPKKLKTIFYRLLDLEQNEDRLNEFFLSMEPAHKVYFLLSVFGSWQSRGEHKRLLERLVHHGLNENSIYVLGFAIAIAAKLRMNIGGIIDRQVLMQKLSESNGLFGLLKWLPTVDYLDQSDDERAAIRDMIRPNSPDLLKMLLLSNVVKMPTVYVDSVYMSGLLGASGVLLLPVSCDLLVAATDKGQVFDSLTRIMASRLAFKPLVISFVSKRIFDKRGAAGLAEIENLRSLYANIADDELRHCMSGALSRIMQYGLACDEEFAKRHREMDRYNECFLFEMMETRTTYDYLELIPEGRLRNNINSDLDTFKATVDDFGAKGVLPRSTVFYDSGKKEIRIEYKTAGQYRVLDPKAFSLTNESVLHACVLASEVYRKACYFRRFTGKVPRVSPENLLIDAATGSVVFRTVGRSLSAIHVIDGTVVGDEDADIARMLATLLETLAFKSQSECAEFIKATTHSGIHAFLCLFIKRLKSKEPGRRYSCSRFKYLVDQLRRPDESLATQNWLEVVYLRERLKGALFRYNSERGTWQGICRAVNDHLSGHIRAVCTRHALREFPFRSRLLFSAQGKRQLHVVTRRLLDLALCRKDFAAAERSNPAYLDLLEFLLLYASICIEVVALAKTLPRTGALQKLASSPLLSRDLVRVRAADYETKVLAGDLAALVIRQPKEKADEPTVEWSLRQLSLISLFSCNIEVGDDTITIEKPQGLRAEVFRAFAHASLVRIPTIEVAVEETIEGIFSTLRSNEDFGRLNRLEEMQDAVRTLGQDLKRVRSGFRVSRRYGSADGRYFPPGVRCRNSFCRAHLVKEEYALTGCALTNSFPSSRTGYYCSWDICDNRLMNLMIPSEGLHSLVHDLVRGKIFGYKLSYLYSGRLMAIWDGAAFVVTALALAICELTKGSTAASAGLKGVCSVLSYLLGTMVLALVGKLLIFDIGHWSSRYQKAKNYIHHKFTSQE